MQLIFQVFGTHHFIKYARKNANIIREYALVLQIIQGLVTTPFLLFNAGAIGVDKKLRSQRVRASTMDLRIAALAEASSD